ncbi:MAG TPA: purine-nucleoside phosphorylase [Chitinophagaceae bacterium]
MNALMERINESVKYIRSLYKHESRVGIVLGSGLGNFAKEIRIEKEIAYDDIPHFPVATVKGHPGKLIFGELGGKKIVAMVGRFHFYEGYPAADVAYPIRVMKFLGISTILISNAAGGVRTTRQVMTPHGGMETIRGFKVGDLMIIRDHISLGTVNPLIGPNADTIGPRFPDMSEPYKKELIVKAKMIAAANKIPVAEGVYFGVTGPTFETRAEYEMIHILGGDAVGMSTVQEVIVARHAGLDVFAMSVITDIGIRHEENIITHDEVLQAAREAEPKLSLIFRELVAAL